MPGHHRVLPMSEKRLFYAHGSSTGHGDAATSPSTFYAKAPRP